MIDIPWKEDPPQGFAIGLDQAEHLARIELTPAQLRALADEAEGIGENRRLTLVQTWTKPGGWHTYVWTPVKRHSLHVAANGNIVYLGDTHGRGGTG